MTNSSHPERFDELEDELRPLVEEICASPAPRGDCERLLNRIAAWGDGPASIAAASPPIVRSGASLAGRVTLVAACLAALLATAANVVLVLRVENAKPAPDDSALMARALLEEIDKRLDRRLTPVSESRESLQSADKRLSGGVAELTSAGSTRVMPYSVGASWAGQAPAAYYRKVLVSDDGNVIAARGPQFPLSLGDVVPASVPDAAVQLWRWRDGVRSSLLVENAPPCLAISRDGKLLATQGQLWDVEAGEPVRSFGFDVVAAEFSPDACVLAAVTSGAANGRISLLDVASGNTLQEIAAPPFSELSLAFTPDGKYLLVAGESVIQRWSVNGHSLAGQFHFGSKRQWGPEQATGAPDTPLAADMPSAWASLAPDGRDEWLDLWYAAPVRATAVEIHETFNPGAVQRVSAFDSEGQEIDLWINPQVAAVATNERRVLKCDAAAPVETKRIRLYIASSAVAGWNEIDAVALLDAGGEKHWAVTASASSTYADRAGRYGSRHTLLAVSPQGDRLLTSGDVTQLWDLESGRLLHRLEPRPNHDNDPFYPDRATGYAVAFAPNGDTIALGTPYNVVLFDAASGAEKRQLPASTAGAAFLRFSPDGRTLTLVNNTYLMRTHPDAPDSWVCPSVQVWDAAAGELVESVP